MFRNQSELVLLVAATYIGTWFIYLMNHRLWRWFQTR